MGRITSDTMGRMRHKARTKDYTRYHWGWGRMIRVTTGAGGHTLRGGTHALQRRRGMTRVTTVGGARMTCDTTKEDDTQPHFNFHKYIHI